MIVLDASAVLELLLNTEVGQRVAARIAPREISLHAPDLLDLEVAQILRRYCRQGVISAERGSQALQHLALLDLERYSHVTLLPRIWALRDNVTAYDAAYISLAEILQATFLTGDRRLLGVPGLKTTIEVIDVTTEH